MAGAAPLLFAAQAGVQAADTVNQYQAEKAQGRYARTAFGINADATRAEAKDALLRGDEAAAAARRDGELVGGAQRTAYAGQGVDPSSGTASAIQAESAQNAEFNALTARNNGWREAWGLRAKASEYDRQGRLATMESKARARSTLATGGLRLLKTGMDYGDFKGDRNREAGQRVRAAYW